MFVIFDKLCQTQNKLIKYGLKDYVCNFRVEKTPHVHTCPKVLKSSFHKPKVWSSSGECRACIVSMATVLPWI